MHIDFVEADLCLDEEKHQEALKKLERLWKDYARELRDPEERELYETVAIKLGILWAQLDRPRKALPILKEALSFSLDEITRGDVCFNLGLCYFDLRDREQAKASFLQAAETASDRYKIKAHYYLGFIHNQEGAYARAVQEFLHMEPRAAEAGIGKDKVYRCLARAYRALGQTDEADRYEKLAKRGSAESRS
jgi:tetratricopeptide (TPR) repeat protein